MIMNLCKGHSHCPSLRRTLQAMLVPVKARFVPDIRLTVFQNLRRGDLLFFGQRTKADKPESIVHVGIYLSDRKFIHCSGRARISSLDPDAPDYDEWHAKGFVRARRFFDPGVSVIEHREAFTVPSLYQPSARVP